MAEQTIVFAQGIEMPPDILAQVQQMKPAGFTLQMLPPGASAAEIAAAIRQAEYLLGFPRFLPDDAYTAAKRLKLLARLPPTSSRIVNQFMTRAFSAQTFRSQCMLLATLFTRNPCVRLRRRNLMR